MFGIRKNTDGQEIQDQQQMLIHFLFCASCLSVFFSTGEANDGVANFMGEPFNHLVACVVDSCRFANQSE